MDAFTNNTVAAVYGKYPSEIHQQMLELRQLIIDTAAETEGVPPRVLSLPWARQRQKAYHQAFYPEPLNYTGSVVVLVLALARRQDTHLACGLGAPQGSVLAADREFAC